MDNYQKVIKHIIANTRIVVLVLIDFQNKEIQSI